jgi:ATP-dependent RNA helicase DeaD
VFCRTKIETQQIADALIKDGYNADSLHGDLSQIQRDLVMKRYRNRSLQMLVATDVAARGIDVNDVTHVVNYNLPDEIENYTHRSGRTARAGKTGISIALVNKRELYKISAIERIVKNKFVKHTIPTGFEVCEKQLQYLVQRLSQTEINEHALQPYIDKILVDIKKLTKEDIIKKWLSLEFNSLNEYYKNAPDLNVHYADVPPYQKKRISSKRLFINLGRLDGFTIPLLREYICTTANVSSASLLWMDVKSSYSFIEIAEDAVERILQNFAHQSYKNRTVRIEYKEQRENGQRHSNSRKTPDKSYKRTS